MWWAACLGCEGVWGEWPLGLSAFTCHVLPEYSYKHHLIHFSHQPSGADAIIIPLQTSPLRLSEVILLPEVTGLMMFKSSDSQPGGPVSVAHDLSKQHTESSQEWQR